MAIRDLIENLKKRNEEELDLPEGETSDRILKVLRTERRKQLEKHEKDILKEQIAEENKKVMREDVFGIHGDIPNDKLGNIGNGKLGKINMNKMNPKKFSYFGGSLKNNKRKRLCTRSP